MIKLLLEAGEKFNTTEKTDERSIIPFNFINPFNSSFINSLILTQNNRISLTLMLNNLTEARLIYRASRDGFEASSFHSKCDNISNTVTIIKTTSNSVFGGFASASWSSILTNNYFNGACIYDSNAFIFSLRRSGNSNKERFNVTQPQWAIYSSFTWGPLFGYDIVVSDNSNTNEKSFSDWGHAYEFIPKNIPDESEYYGQSYLAGSFFWQTTEIEVYQVTPFIPYSVTFLHDGCIFLFDFKKLTVFAVYNNNTDLLNLLIRIGINLNIQDKYGLTPLHYG
jgi:hypothetical protein